MDNRKTKLRKGAKLTWFRVILNSCSIPWLDAKQRNCFLRSTLGIVLLTFSVWQIVYSGDFVRFLFIQELTPIPDQILIKIHGTALGATAVWLVSGHKPRLTSAVAALILILIVIELALHRLLFFGLILRNVVLIAAAISLSADPSQPPKLGDRVWKTLKSVGSRLWVLRVFRKKTWLAMLFIPCSLVLSGFIGENAFVAEEYGISEDTNQYLSQWYDEKFLDDAVVFEKSLFGWLFGVFGQKAVTINKQIHITKNAPDLNEDDWGRAILAHELIHVQQQDEMGWWRFLYYYLLSWRPAHVTNGMSHFLEKPAYQRGAEVYNASGNQSGSPRVLPPQTLQ